MANHGQPWPTMAAIFIVSGGGKERLHRADVLLQRPQLHQGAVGTEIASGND